MEGGGVIVECFVSENGKKNGESNSPKSLSCSGTYLGSGLVLTHGTIATDILQHPASQSILQVLGTGGWVVNGGCREKHVSKVHSLSSVNNPRVKGKSSEYSSHSDESQLSTAISITQAKFQVILPVSNNNLVAQGFIDTSTSGSQSAANGSPHKQLTIKEWQNQDGDNSGYSCHNFQKLKNSNQGAEKVSKYKEWKQKNEVDMSFPTNTHTLKLLTVRETNQSLALKQPSLSQSYNSVPAQIERLLTIPSLRQKIEGLMPASEGWKFTEGKEDGKENNSVIDSIILSTFVVLQITPSNNSRDEGGKVLDETEVVQVVKKMLAQTSHVYKGATVYIESSPFGSLCPDVFLNSLSRGVINNATPPLILTDARCVLGSEGAPVFASLGKRPDLCAMVISPFFWRQGEWLGLALLASIQPVLRTILLSCSQSEDPPHSLPNPPVGTEEQGKVLMGGAAWTGDLESSEKMLMKGIEGSVVGVWGGDKWGSGVVVSSRPPLILTCAHVTQPAKNGRVTVVLSDGRKMYGQVLHQTQPVGPSTGKEGTNGGSIWDLAVVGVSQPLPPPLILSTHLPYTGSDVLVVGYGMFSPTRLPSPSISCGVLSKLITVPLTSFVWPLYHHVQPYFTPNCPQELVIGYVSKSYSHQPEDSTDSFPKQDQSNNQTSTLNQHMPMNFSLGHGQTNHSPCMSKAQLSTSHSCQNSKGEAEIKPSHQDTKDVADIKANHTSDHSINGDFSRCTKDQKRQMHKRSVVVMMQTTCSVYAGTSGGPVIAIHPTLGPLVVGIVTCNIRDHEKKCIFPNINMAAPTPLVARIIDAFIKTRNPRVLHLLDVACPEASHLWSLGSAPQAHL